MAQTTEMYIELAISNYKNGFESALKKVPSKPVDIVKKGELVFSTNNPGKVLRQVFDKNGKPRVWKESFITYQFSCDDLVLETSLSRMLKTVDKLKKFESFKKAKYGVKVVIYFKDERPDASLSEKIIKKLAFEKCYLDIVLY